MDEIKRLFLLVIVLVFVGGVGIGAWVGTLTAGPEPTLPAVDRRVADFQREFPDLSAMQVIELRRTIAEYDREVARIRDKITREQFARKLAAEEEAREKIRRLMTEEQRKKYDRLIGRK